MTTHVFAEFHDAVENRQPCFLPCAAGTDDAKDFALANREGNVAQGPEVFARSALSRGQRSA